MSGILVLILRVVFALLLYVFLYWTFSVIWRDLRFRMQEQAQGSIPALLIQPLDRPDAEAIRFQTHEVILGRNALCHLCIPDETVSARHARFIFQQNQWWVEDLNSTNGSFLNGERLTTRAALVSGDELRCGQVIFRIELEAKNQQL